MVPCCRVDSGTQKSTDLKSVVKGQVHTDSQSVCFTITQELMGRGDDVATFYIQSVDVNFTVTL